MNIIQIKHYQFNGDRLKELSKSKALKEYSGIPEDVVVEAWLKADPKRKKKDVEDDND